MGAGRSVLNVVWDTGSFVYLGETYLCSTCPEPKYDFRENIGGSYTHLYEEYVERYADGTELTGSWATDTICVADDPTACVPEFKWVAIYKT